MPPRISPQQSRGGRGGDRGGGARGGRGSGRGGARGGGPTLGSAGPGPGLPGGQVETVSCSSYCIMTLSSQLVCRSE